MESKYKAGEIVVERIRPDQELIVRSHIGLMYYCLAPEHPTRKELVFFERELMPKKF